MMPALVPDGLGRDGTPVGLNGRRSISFQALWRSIHHQKWIPLQRYLNIRPSKPPPSLSPHICSSPHTHTHTSTPPLHPQLQVDRVQ